MGLSWAQIQPASRLGPGDLEPDPHRELGPDELSGPNQGPPSTRPGKKYVAQGTLAAMMIENQSDALD